MIVQGKVWGHTIPIFCKNNVEVNKLKLNKDHRCSKHVHDSKYNMFYVIDGKIKVSTWKNEYELVDEIILIEDQGTIVSPKEYHRFEVLEDSIILEVYWVELDVNDIDREDVGK
jgi:quercetin dioxygenase-like cupin family protein